MKNITSQNLSFLRETIINDLKIAKLRSNNGFAITKIDNVVQNQELNFESKDYDISPMSWSDLSNYTTNGYPYLYGEGILLDDDFHMFGHQASSFYTYGNRHIVYHFKTKTFEFKGYLPRSFGRGYGYRSYQGTNLNGACNNASVIYYNNNFHLFVSATYGNSIDYNTNYHYILVDNTNSDDNILVETISDLPNGFFCENVKGIVYNNKIHFFRHNNDNSIPKLLHYTYDEINGYTELDPLPFYVRTKSANLFDIVLYNNKIHFPIAKKSDDSSTIYHFTWDDTNGYIQVEQYTTVVPEFSSDVFVHNNEIYMINLASSNESTCIWNDTNKLRRINGTNYYDGALIQVGSSNVNSNRFISYNNELYYTTYFSNSGYEVILAKYNCGEWTVCNNNNYYKIT